MNEYAPKSSMPVGDTSKDMQKYCSNCESYQYIDNKTGACRNCGFDDHKHS